MTKIVKINFLKAGLPTEYYNKVSVFCIPACLGGWEVEFLVGFWISDLKVTAGIFQNCTFRVSGNAKPHRGLAFFYPKNEIPPGSRTFRVSGSVKPHRGLVFFFFKKASYTLWFAISDTLKVQDTLCVFYFFNQKMPATPCSLLPQIP